MKKNHWLILLIFVFGLLLRFIYLSKIPSELNRDEASVGFNAYSLLKTGKDEHGRGPWPLVFKAFGDYKIPGYIYLTVPLVKIFGLNAFSVRFPAALFGSLTILAIYFLLKELWPKKENLALLTAFLLTMAPFHLHYSRQQFEAPVALFFSLTGIFLLLKARKKTFYLFISLPFFICSFFTYNASLFIVPILVIFTILIFNKEYLLKSKWKTILVFIILLALSWLGYWQLIKEGNLGRANTTIFNQLKNTQQIEHSLHYLNNSGMPLFIARIFYNKPLSWFNEFIKNYLAAFNPKFIFVSGDNNSWHGLGQLNYGNILFVLLPFIALGFYQLFTNLSVKENLWLLGYFLIAPLANGITIDSPILTRLLDFHLILIIFSAIGLNFLWQRYCKDRKILNFTILFLLVFYNLSYLISYFIIFPKNLDNFWNPGIKEAVELIKNRRADYDAIFVSSNLDVGYIFLAFYLPFEPSDFQENAVWGLDGFEKVKTYKKFYFDKNSLSIEKREELKELVGNGKNILLLERLTPADHPRKEDYNTFIYNSLGQPLWQFTFFKT